LKYFLSLRTFEQLALALKTEFALKLFKPRGATAFPASYAYDPDYESGLAVLNGHLIE